MPAGLSRLCAGLVIGAVLASAAGFMPVPAKAPRQGSSGSQASEAQIETYIRSGWDRLSRSTGECASLADPKVTTPPLLYLPFGMKTPPSLLPLRDRCQIRIEHLPRPIAKLGDVLPAELSAEGLLYLPNRYVVTRDWLATTISVLARCPRWQTTAPTMPM